MNFKDTNPIYLQIAERICDEILQGTYREDDRIPSVREYAAMVEVNANTVVRTFDHLQSLEIIYNKRGLGYFVAKGAVRRIAKERKRTFLTEELPELFRKMDTLQLIEGDFQRIHLAEKFGEFFSEEGALALLGDATCCTLGHEVAQATLVVDNL